jgi:hypothetical protein
LIIYGLVYMSIAIQHHVLLFMLPSPVAVCSGSSQQLSWVFGFSFSAHRFWGGREREAAARQFAGGANERSRKDRHSGNDERTRAALPGFTLYL